MFGTYHTFALREVCGVGLCGEVTLVVFSQAYVEMIKSDVTASLCQESHTFSIMNVDIVDICVIAMVEEYSRSWTTPCAHCYYGSSFQPIVFPVRSMKLTFTYLYDVFGVNP